MILHRMRLQAALLAVLVGGAATTAVFAKDPWKKDPADWTREDAVRILKKSPWAKEQRVSHVRVPQDPEYGGPVRIGKEPPPDTTRLPEREEAVAWYIVRWESAWQVRSAFERLVKLDADKDLESLGPSARRPDEYFVVTVHTITPPILDRDLFDRTPDWKLMEKAELTLGRVPLNPVEVERHGTESHPTVTFFFPRTYRGKPLLQSGGKVRFKLFNNLFNLRATFDLPAGSIE